MWDLAAELSSTEVGVAAYLGKVARIVEAWVSPQGSTSRRCILVRDGTGMGE